MIRRGLGLVGAMLALMLATASAPASAAIPEGPRLSVVKLDYMSMRIDVFNVDERGAFPVRVAGASARAGLVPEPYSRPGWSPDGSTIAFTAAVGDPTKAEGVRGRLFLAGPDGSGRRPLPGGHGGFDPVFAPDGRSLVFTRFKQLSRPGRGGRRVVTFASASVWELDLASGQQRRLTPSRNGLFFIPSSFSPDGSALALTRIDEMRGGAFDAVVLWRANGKVELLAANAWDPAFSPDGSKIALVGESIRDLRKKGLGDFEETSDLYVLETGRLGMRRVTRTPLKQETSPSWDPSGARLAYIQSPVGFSAAALLGLRSAVIEVNGDGSCPTQVLSYPRAALNGVRWQPGPGREAGPISC